MHEHQNGIDGAPNHSRKLGNKEFALYLKSQPRIAALAFNVEKYLSNYKPFYYNAVLSFLKGRDLQVIERQLTKEYEQLVSGKSFLHKINKAIFSRERCLDKIKRDFSRVERVLTVFQKSYSRKNDKSMVYSEFTAEQGYTAVEIDETIEASVQMIKNLFLDLARLREMTMYIVETIHRWRLEIEQWMDKCGNHSRIDFWIGPSDYKAAGSFEDSNEAEKSIIFYDLMQSDTDFLWRSKLSEYIWFESKSDPLMVKNVIFLFEKPEEEKTVLEKYYIEIMYPKSDDILEKTIRALEMLSFEYQPKQINLYEEQEKLIENYLAIERQTNDELGLGDSDFQRQMEQIESSRVKKSPKRLQGSQSAVRIGMTKQLRHEIESDNEKWGKPNSRGWVFGKQLKRPSQDRIRELVKKHQVQMNYLKNHKGMVKTFNVPSQSEKNSVALAYLSQVGPIKRPTTEIVQKVDHSKKLQNSRSTRMHQSLVKINEIIAQDPKEEQAETPKMKQKKAKFSHSAIRQLPERQATSSIATRPGRAVLEHQIKINSIFDEEKAQGEEIKIQEEETPLTTKLFFQVFRADTNKPLKSMSESRASSHLFKSTLKGTAVENGQETQRLIDQKRMKSLNHFKKLPISLRKSPYGSLTKKQEMKKKTGDKSSDKNGNSFRDYKKIDEGSLPQDKQPVEAAVLKESKQFISLINRQITRDMVGIYVRHLCSQLPINSQSFTNYHTPGHSKRLIQTLQDPTVHSILLELEGEQDGKLGHAIVVESLSSELKLRYVIEFINVCKFQLLGAGICRISEELLSTTPCQQVVLKLMEDKEDPVSTHFISLIDQLLKKRAERFCFFHVLEKKLPSLSGQNLHERVYIFESKSRKAADQLLKNRAIGSHRVLNIESKCLVMSSNFKLRSQNLIKATIEKYKDESIGSLFVVLLAKIMTKYHLKQLKVASLSMNDSDEMVGVVRNSPYLRTVFHRLLEHIRRVPKGQVPEWTKGSVTKFSNMTDLLNYLAYKEYDLVFKFDFLAESRFILSHQLTLSQLNLEASLEFIVEASAGMLLLNNHKDLVIEEVSRNHNEHSPQGQALNSSRFKVSSHTNGYLLPTTQDHLKLLVMSAKEYLDCTDNLDLYSYLQLAFNESVIKKRSGVPQIVLPDFTKRKARINNVKMYDGFLRLFPEREFYSASYFHSTNAWENLYPSAVISLPSEDALIFDYPLIVGFYDAVHNEPMSAFLLRPEAKK